MHNFVYMYINNHGWYWWNRKHGTLDPTDDDRANGLGSNRPKDTFLYLKKGQKAVYNMYVTDEKNYPMIGVI